MYGDLSVTIVTSKGSSMFPCWKMCACILYKCVFILLPVVENTKRHDISSKFLPGCVLPKTVQAMYEYCGSFWNQLKSLYPAFPVSFPELLPTIRQVQPRFRFLSDIVNFCSVLIAQAALVFSHIYCDCNHILSKVQVLCWLYKILGYYTKLHL